MEDWEQCSTASTEVIVNPWLETRTRLSIDAVHREYMERDWRDPRWNVDVMLERSLGLSSGSGAVLREVLLAEHACVAGASFFPASGAKGEEMEILVRRGSLDEETTGECPGARYSRPTREVRADGLPWWRIERAGRGRGSVVYLLEVTSESLTSYQMSRARSTDECVCVYGDGVEFPFPWITAYSRARVERGMLVPLILGDSAACDFFRVQRRKRFAIADDGRLVDTTSVAVAFCTAEKLVEDDLWAWMCSPTLEDGIFLDSRNEGHFVALPVFDSLPSPSECLRSAGVKQESGGSLLAFRTSLRP
ncbi:uncharacterized protein B0I36DRAFT_316174 [Microdochium trichocladiopsis]|uniref:Uncharacterized protein n=1 Tax=Microdochium trichocladiopsis TaxID=1682393 RepID=A0A9P9BUQ7_9PEZI|nr:uncharacterized protein B0I36DRAFT_316174 [Microdochium trichocladiopsis]KAH7038412.1 hypothetical protein B0I36DRAFT_316174 [Microdochium trichocladiopsis]